MMDLKQFNFISLFSDKTIFVSQLDQTLHWVICNLRIFCLGPYVAFLFLTSFQSFEEGKVYKHLLETRGEK